MSKYIKKTIIIFLFFTILLLPLVYTRFKKNYIENLKPTVLLFHHFSGDVNENDPYSVTPQLFENIIKTLQESGYTFTNLESYYDSKGRVPKKSIIITIDDGYESNYLIAFDILKRYQIPADIFLVTNLLNKDNSLDSAYLNIDQLIEMRDSGLVKFYSHSNSHRNFAELDEEEIIDEITISGNVLSNIFGKENHSFFSYPYGKYSLETVKLLENLGVELQLFVYDRIKELKGEWYVLNRHIIENSTDIQSIISIK